MISRSETQFKRFLRLELEKGERRYGTPFIEQSILSRGETVEDCIKKELAGVYLYATLLPGWRAWLARKGAYLLFQITRPEFLKNPFRNSWCNKHGMEIIISRPHWYGWMKISLKWKRKHKGKTPLIGIKIWHPNDAYATLFELDFFNFSFKIEF